MRDLKFRAWNGTSLQYSQSLGSFFDCISDDDIVEQFTGLQDDEGRDIYDGDICDVSTFTDGKFISAVEWNDCECLFGFIVTDCEHVMSLDGSMHIKVIGNIHTTPELMK